ncbi:class A beta-lactamase-related serine hydrolase [Robertkochia marina]|uniref:Class A beta-lactamase-related serine hydrolase n=1 Tax=Robertkochia marina TaxID=1227945 RepID=A0A4S3M0D4_9FLAO|nr:serine hydrolase domain-containing protein [Robertkochia marina]THD66467.1 class A beta-lactamase-related serine hydrolase [Robertkochia marina]TRZ44145.1 class A beta-lactamase-related serine hydrolase [Robertkochia marina]
MSFCLFKLRPSTTYLTFFLVASFFIPVESRGQEFEWNQNFDAKIDSVVEQIMKDFHHPGVALALIQNGEVLKESYYGLASIEFKVPVTDSTVFWLGSISKHYDCVAILKLQEQGKLHIKDSIYKYLPDIPVDWRGITIEHLMTHTSGLPFDGQDSSRGSNSVKDNMVYTSEIMYEGLKKDSLRFKPGTNFLYSGAGYSLLSLIMEKQSGMPYAEFMEKEIFHSLGMENTYIMDVTGIRPNQATGYRWHQGRLQLDRNDFRLIDKELGAGGGVYTTLKDMITWNAMLNSDQFLSRESIDSMFTTYVLNDGTPIFYGYGFFISANLNNRIVSHTGIAGTEYLKNSGTQIDMIILTNLGQPVDTPFRYQISKALNILPYLSVHEFASAFKMEIGNPDTYSLEQLLGQYEGDPELYPIHATISKADNQFVILYSESKTPDGDEIPISLYPLKNHGVLEFEHFHHYPATHFVMYKPVFSGDDHSKVMALEVYYQGKLEGVLKKLN